MFFKKDNFITEHFSYFDIKMLPLPTKSKNKCHKFNKMNWTQQGLPVGICEL